MWSVFLCGELAVADEFHSLALKFAWTLAILQMAVASNTSWEAAFYVLPLLHRCYQPVMQYPQDAVQLHTTLTVSLLSLDSGLNFIWAPWLLSRFSKVCNAGGFPDTAESTSLVLYMCEIETEAKKKKKGDDAFLLKTKWQDRSAL